MTKLKTAVLLSIGAATGLCASFGLQVWASDSQDNTLPLQDVRQFSNTIQAIKAYYVDDVKDKKLFESAMEGMVSGLDPHSNYLDAKGYKELNESTEGSFGGLGIEVSKDPAGVLVISPIDDTPAARAGLQAGDIITRIDGKSLAEVSLNGAVKRMRGEPNTEIEVTVARKGVTKPLTFKLTRAIIKTKSIKMKELKGDLGYIRISQFQQRTTEDLAKALNELATKNHLKGLVLDLRNDPGGLLPAAVGVVAAFVPKDTTVVSTKGRVENSQTNHKTVPDDYDSGDAINALSKLTPMAKKVPMVVLINSSSASASEIVAGALQDLKRATIMGDRSFGKGSVQTIFPMKYGKDTVAVKLTTARYYTPSGRSIQAKGIEPSIYVDDTPKGNYPSFTIRESDLNHHLKNPTDSTEDEDAMLDKLPYSDDEGERPDYTFKFGDDKDWQLQQAINFLEGKKVEVSKYRGKTRAEVRKLKDEEEKAKEAKEAKKDAKKATSAKTEPQKNTEPSKDKSAK